jgi:DNA-binding CsgD family transcriptional regulator
VPATPSASLPGPRPDLPVPQLSRREIDVLVAWLRADSKEEAASALLISPTTLSTHIRRIRAKYSAVGRPAVSKTVLFARAIQDGHLSLGDW